MYHIGWEDPVPAGRQISRSTCIQAVHACYARLFGWTSSPRSRRFPIRWFLSRVPFFGGSEVSTDDKSALPLRWVRVFPVLPGKGFDGFTLPKKTPGFLLSLVGETTLMCVAGSHRWPAHCETFPFLSRKATLSSRARTPEYASRRPPQDNPRTKEVIRVVLDFQRHRRTLVERVYGGLIHGWSQKELHDAVVSPIDRLGAPLESLCQLSCSFFSYFSISRFFSAILRLRFSFSR